MKNGWRLPNRAAFLVSQIFNLVLNQQATILSPLSDKTTKQQNNIKQWDVAVVTVDIKPRPTEIPWNTGPTVQAIKWRYITSQLEGKECLATAATSLKPPPAAALKVLYFAHTAYSWVSYHYWKENGLIQTDTCASFKHKFCSSSQHALHVSAVLNTLLPDAHNCWQW